MKETEATSQVFFSGNLVERDWKKTRISQIRYIIVPSHSLLLLPVVLFVFPPAYLCDKPCPRAGGGERALAGLTAARRSLSWKGIAFVTQM